MEYNNDAVVMDMQFQPWMYIACKACLHGPSPVTVTHTADTSTPEQEVQSVSKILTHFQNSMVPTHGYLATICNLVRLFTSMQYRIHTQSPFFLQFCRKLSSCS